MNIIQAIILGIVEGLTEFLPVSSTGHMIIASRMLGLDIDSSFVKLFEIVIQFGAILSIIIIYWKRFLMSLDFYVKLGIAVIPALIFGFLLHDHIQALMGQQIVVGMTWLLGGIFLLFVDRIFKQNEITPDNKITNRKAITIGLFQVISLIPGVSRSAATIVGGLTQKLNRKAAAEFSFFLAVPTMAAASGYELLKYVGVFEYIKKYKSGLRGVDLTNTLISVQHDELVKIGIGALVAFIVAIITVRAMIFIVTKYGFRAFGWYRIIAGTAIIVTFILGISLKMTS